MVIGADSSEEKKRQKKGNVKEEEEEKVTPQKVMPPEEEKEKVTPEKMIFRVNIFIHPFESFSPLGSAHKIRAFCVVLVVMIFFLCSGFGDVA